MLPTSAMFQGAHRRWIMAATRGRNFPTLRYKSSETEIKRVLKAIAITDRPLTRSEAVFNRSAACTRSIRADTRKAEQVNEVEARR